MPLAPGERLGPYEIVAPIGAGGMGEVYLARDPRLGRDVAIKVSAAQFSERFRREAQAIAALNHPNICTLYDVGPSYLVMEHIEGVSPKGPLPLEQVLRIASQVADALEAAHDKGVTHRDLKPGNLKLRPDGMVKVLDFGLAKTNLETTSLENSPTMLTGATQSGVILGTVGYMSPEQSRGEPVDKRSDIWAYGVLVYELLTGNRPFEGKTVADTLAAVLTAEPDLSAVPEKVRHLLSVCLEKNPKRRLRDIGEAWRFLEDAPVEKTQTNARAASWLWPGIAAAMTVLAAVLSWGLWRVSPPTHDQWRFQISAPEGANFNNAAPVLSPDGKALAYILGGSGEGQIWIRPRDAVEPRLLPGTTGATNWLFWSPDGRSLAFTAGPPPYKLKRIDLAGGAAQTLCETQSLVPAGDWNTENVVLFGTAGSGVSRVSAAGGDCTSVTVLDPSRGETGHQFPTFLPDGKHFLYLRRSSKPEIEGIYIGSLDKKPEEQGRDRLLTGRSKAVFAPGREGQSGHILFLREGTLMAQPFGPDRLTIQGDPVPVAEQVGRGNGQNIGGLFSVSRTGSLAYRTGPSEMGDLLVTIFDRQGKVLEGIGPKAQYDTPSYSPDGTRVLFSRSESQFLPGDLWFHDFGSGRNTKFTFNTADDWSPVWSKDGTRILFSSDRTGPGDLYIGSVTHPGSEESFYKSADHKFPTDWSPDGRSVLFTQLDSKGNADIWLMPIDGTGKAGKPVSYLPTTPYRESDARFSPDGHFVVFASNRSGTSEVLVQTFPDPRGGQWQISAGGGQVPRWSRDGKTIYYMSAIPNTNLMMVDVSRGPDKAGTPQLLARLANGPPGFDVDPTREKFVKSAVDTSALALGAPITVVVNWETGLKK